MREIEASMERNERASGTIPTCENPLTEPKLYGVPAFTYRFDSPSTRDSLGWGRHNTARPVRRVMPLSVSMECWSAVHRAFVVEAYVKHNDSVATQRLFRQHFKFGRERMVPERHAITNWVSKYRATASVADKKSGGSVKSVRTQENIDRPNETSLIRSVKRSEAGVRHKPELTNAGNGLRGNTAIGKHGCNFCTTDSSPGRLIPSQARSIPKLMICKVSGSSLTGDSQSEEVDNDKIATGANRVGPALIGHLSNQSQLLNDSHVARQLHVSTAHAEREQFYLRRGICLNADFSAFCAARSWEPMRAIEVRMKQRRNEITVETGDPLENPPISSIVRHDSHMRKSRSEPAGE
ncbi:hypothetical protein PR048_022082 [Dryococelus australis]|uniref:DUF4817 domain-containing protein n=1 Tax=Dryococelus australis TaxID=614101 RepID=A0ABQ9H053_9NEOP|nr:hypothetical protein PR048_022082 [Dryococelus australis]